MADFTRTLQSVFGRNSEPLIELITATPLAICITDDEGYFRFANRSYCDLYGYALDELIGSEFTKVLPEQDREMARQRHLNFILYETDELYSDGNISLNEWVVVRRDGRRIFVRAAAQRISDGFGKFYKVTYVVDITPHKKVEERLSLRNSRLEYIANHDALMSVFNRRSGLELMGNLVKKAEKTRLSLSVALIDIDNFKLINDMHGHLVGDEVLRELAPILSQNLREGDVLVRYGGEELLVLMPGSNAVQAETSINRVLKVVAATPVSSQGIRVTFSAGIVDHQEGDSIGDLLERADLALYEAKKTRNTVSVWPIPE